MPGEFVSCWRSWRGCGVVWRSGQSVRRSCKVPRVRFRVGTQGHVRTCAPTLCPWERHFTRIPPQLEGRVSNGSWLQLADESSARRAGVVKADLERNQVIRQLAASTRTGTSTSPSMDPLGKTGFQVCGSQIRNLLSTLNKSTRRPPCQL
ncbi:hypothetical protein Bbelb_086130 [Branchiostoma belcheri]|nr:hypothetical protein Bbelb_086130 [Branchiostoma belcheri]